MNEIGLLLKETRESSGVTLQEASNDVNISEIILKNIEDGNIGSFKDISLLKDYIKEYAKYLGINSQAVIDEFNNFMFEYTSKITTKPIEKAIREKNRMEKKEDRIYSPYTINRIDNKMIMKYVGIVVGVLFIIFTIFIIIKFIIMN